MDCKSPWERGSFLYWRRVLEYGEACVKENVIFEYENRSQTLPPMYLALMLLSLVAINAATRIAFKVPWYSRGYRMACEGLTGSCASTPFQSSKEEGSYKKWKTSHGETILHAPDGQRVRRYQRHCGVAEPKSIPVYWRPIRKEKRQAQGAVLKFVTSGAEPTEGPGTVWWLKPVYAPVGIVRSDGSMTLRIYGGVLLDRW
jgi:hypothetical protein